MSPFAALPAWDDASIEKAFEHVAAANGDIKLGKLAQPVRVAVTGGPVSPGIHETLAVLGPARTLARIDDAIARIERRDTSGAPGD